MTEPMRHLRVRKHDEFQHYKDRNPPWIKLHQALLTSYNFLQLPDASRWHAIGCALLASRCDNHLPSDSDFLKTALHSQEEVDIDALVACKFLVWCDCDECKHGASNSLATCSTKVDKSVLREEKRERREETEKNTRLSARGSRWKIESFTLPDGVPDDDLTLGALQGWLDYRKAARQKPYTSNRWIVGAWKRCGESRGALLAAVENSLEHEYQGIYPASASGKQAQSLPNEKLTPAERVQRFGSLY